MQLSSEKNTGRSAVGLRHAYLPGGFVEQGDPLAPQQFGGLSLGLLPGRHRLLDQPLPLRRQPEGLGTELTRLSQSPVPNAAVVTSPATRSVCHALHSGSAEVTWPLAYPNTGSANRRYDGVPFAST